MKKKLKIILTVIVVLSLSSFAKKQGGVYMNLADYKNNKLTYEVDCRINLNNSLWNMPYITVVDHGKKRRLKKSELFGYRDCDKEVYRFYNNDEYRIAEAGNIYIYTQTQNIAQSKGYKVVNAYYFSTTPGTAIIPLTLDNIKNAYRDNEKFLDLLDQFFKNGDVHAYDNVHKTFKVNYVYSKATKQ